MKNLVREHIIFEKFVADSDPIHDLGIGVCHQYEEWCKAHHIDINSPRSLAECASDLQYDFVKYLLFTRNMNPDGKGVKEWTIGAPLGML